MNYPEYSIGQVKDPRGLNCYVCLHPAQRKHLGKIPVCVVCAKTYGISLPVEPTKAMPARTRAAKIMEEVTPLPPFQWNLDGFGDMAP